MFPITSFQRPREDVEPVRSNKKKTTSESVGKERFIWTDDLHTSFVEAVTKLGDLGTKSANLTVLVTPKNVLNEMRIEGLTYANVHTHLRMYRGQQKKETADLVRY